MQLQPMRRKLGFLETRFHQRCVVRIRFAVTTAGKLAWAYRADFLFGNGSIKTPCKRFTRASDRPARFGGPRFSCVVVDGRISGDLVESKSVEAIDYSIDLHRAPFAATSRRDLKRFDLPNAPKEMNARRLPTP